MKNITLAIEENLLNAGREYAKEHGTSLNGLIRKLLEQTVKQRSNNWLEDCFRLMDKAKGNSRGKKWKREDLYDV